LKKIKRYVFLLIPVLSTKYFKSRDFPRDYLHTTKAVRFRHKVTLRTAV